MARKTRSTAAVTVSAPVDAARQTYIDSLNAQREAALTVLQDAQKSIAEANAAVESHTATARSIEAQLRTLGVEIANPVSAGRGRPTGSRNRSADLPEGRTRHSNEVSLPDAILLFMGGQKPDTTFNLDEILEGVTKAGYRSTSDNPKVIVNQSLAGLMKSKRVRRVERGTYAISANGRKAATAVSEALSAAE